MDLFFRQFFGIAFARPKHCFHIWFPSSVKTIKKNSCDYGVCVYTCDIYFSFFSLESRRAESEKKKEKKLSTEIYFHSHNKHFSLNREYVLRHVFGSHVVFFSLVCFFSGFLSKFLPQWLNVLST